MAKTTTQKRITPDDGAWDWYAIVGDGRANFIAELSAEDYSFEPFFRAAEIASLPKGLSGDKQAKKYYEALRPSSNYLKDDWGKVANLISAHGSHVGVEHRILWKFDGPTVQWNAAPSGNSSQPVRIVVRGNPWLNAVNSALVLTDGFLFYTFGETALIFSVYSMPAEPLLVPGMVQGKILLPVDDGHLAGLGVDFVSNILSGSFSTSWLEAQAASHSLFQESGRANSAYAFLPKASTFLCDGADCGILASTSESYEKRRALLGEVFQEVGLSLDALRFPDLMSAWHAVVLKAAADSEAKGTQVATLASHAQLVLGVSGPLAKALVKLARSRGLLEFPLDVEDRYDDPGGKKPSADLPFPIEGFARLCVDCYDTFNSN